MLGKQLLIALGLTLLAAGDSADHRLISLPLESRRLQRSSTLEKLPKATNNVGTEDYHIYTTLYIGGTDKRNEFKLMIDTGSSWLWVTDRDCTNCASTSNRLDYDSRNLKDNKMSATLAYSFMDGAWIKGKRMTDNVSVGRLNAEAIDVLSVLEVDPNSIFATNKWNFDGILGLAPAIDVKTKDGVAIRQKTMIYEMYRQNFISHNMFSIHLTDWWRNQGAETSSKIWFGGYPHDKIRELNGWDGFNNKQIDDQIVWIMTNGGSKKIWEFRVNKVTMKAMGSSYSVMPSRGGSGIVQIRTGAVFNTLPRRAYERLEKQVQTAFNQRCTFNTDPNWNYKGLYCPCRPATLDSLNLPSFTYAFTSETGVEAKFQFTAKYYFQFEVNNAGQGSNTERQCLLAFKPAVTDNRGRASYTLGSSFLRRYFSIFDLSEGRQRIGLIGGKFPHITPKWAGALVKTTSEWRYERFAIWWICCAMLIGMIAIILLVCFCVRGCTIGCCREPKRHLKITHIEPPRYLFQHEEMEEAQVIVRPAEKKQKVSFKKKQGQEVRMLKKDQECLQTIAERQNKILFDKIHLADLQAEMKEKVRLAQHTHQLQRSESNTTIRTDNDRGITPKNRDLIRHSSMRNSIGIDDSFDQRSQMSDKQVSWKEDHVRGGAAKFARRDTRDNDFERSVTSVISEHPELGDFQGGGNIRPIQSASNNGRRVRQEVIVEEREEQTGFTGGRNRFSNN